MTEKLCPLVVERYCLNQFFHYCLYCFFLLLCFNAELRISDDDEGRWAGLRLSAVAVTSNAMSRSLRV